ncbi:hypothetical protein [Undibacterium sp.]|uniref:hypothetical protein n=1 Tax=Undibacterium sp. TaxID=1914977 RepID=UPI0027300D74|nr:hypothetical protein [Undibacterium sp.]MDP1980535.1 hypothetical protein [Undibacterium sp.]
MAITRIIGPDGLPYRIASPDEMDNEFYHDWPVPGLPPAMPGLDSSGLLPLPYPGQPDAQDHIRMMPFSDIHNNEDEQLPARLYARLPAQNSRFLPLDTASNSDDMPSHAPVKGLLLRAMAANDESGVSEPAAQTDDLDRWSYNPMLEREEDASEDQAVMRGKMGLLNRFSYPDARDNETQITVPGEWKNDVRVIRNPYEEHINQLENFSDSHASLQLYAPVPLSYSKVGQGPDTKRSMPENLSHPYFQEMIDKNFPLNHRFLKTTNTSSLDDDSAERQNNLDSTVLLNEMNNNINSPSWGNSKTQYALLTSNGPGQLVRRDDAPISLKREFKKFISEAAERTTNLKKNIWRAYDEKKQQQELLNTLNPNELKPFPLIRHPRTGDAPNTFNGKEPPAPEFLPDSTSPTINRGKGSGTWKENETEYLSIAGKKVTQGLLTPLEILYPDATKHLQHYFDNNGEDYHVDLKKIVETTDAGRDLYLSQRNAAIKYAMENAKDGVPFSFSSKRLEQRAFAEGSENWFYASGNFSGYSQSNVIKNGDEFNMNFELNFVDPYNWDRKNTDIGLLKIADDTLAKLHKQGIAKDFLLKGKLPLIITWKSGSEMNPVVKIDQSKMPKPGGP